MAHTVRFHRVMKAPAERLYRAFLDPDALVKWLPPHGFTARVHHLEPQVGGTYRMSFTNFSRNRHSDGFDNPDLPGEMVTTITFREVSCGTELEIVQAGIPEAIPPEACVLGWQESLTLLALLVEPDIPA